MLSLDIFWSFAGFLTAWNTREYIASTVSSLKFDNDSDANIFSKLLQAICRIFSSVDVTAYLTIVLEILEAKLKWGVADIKRESDWGPYYPKNENEEESDGFY